MHRIIPVVFAIITACLASCTRSASELGNALDEAEKAMNVNTDSAMLMLDAIDLQELQADSLRARYHYLKAYGHMRQNRSMIGDSLILFSYNYYRGKDVVRDIRSGIASAWYKFWVGDTQGATSLLDSITGRNDIPDSLMTQALHVRVLLGASEYQGHQLIPLAKRLIRLETDPMRQLEAKYMLVGAYENAGMLDSALTLTDQLLSYSAANHLGEQQFIFDFERAQIFGEMGRYKESDDVVTYIFDNAGADNGAADLLHLQRAMNAINTGMLSQASRSLTLADSIAMILRSEDDSYYRSYSNLLHTIIDFKLTGRLRLTHVNSLNNRQRERFNRVKASQWESERAALQLQSRTLALKAESEHKTVIILVIALLAIISLSLALWIIRSRRNRERENEERAEALQKMVDELRSTPAAQPSVETPAPLRRAMLQQLGIIKMVAETPTEQNREMLRKISSIDGETNGELVNWNNLFELIDNLYSNFYTKLHDKYGDTLSTKEEQIIVLIMAGFSTKEISVITGQTTATIYVRKSSIRKKLSLPEKEDILSHLRTEFSI